MLEQVQVGSLSPDLAFAHHASSSWPLPWAGFSTLAPGSLDHGKSRRVPEKHLFLLYWLCQSLWLCGSQQTRKFWKRREYQTTWPSSWEICMQVRKQLTEHGTIGSSQIGKGVCQGCMLSPCLFNLYAEYNHVKCWAEWSTRWNLDCQEKYQ